MVNYHEVSIGENEILKKQDEIVRLRNADNEQVRKKLGDVNEPPQLLEWNVEQNASYKIEAHYSSHGIDCSFRSLAEISYFSLLGCRVLRLNNRGEKQVGSLAILISKLVSLSNSELHFY